MADRCGGNLASVNQTHLVQVAHTDDGECLRVDRTAGAAPEGRVIELWLLKDDTPPVSLGVLPCDETGPLVVAEALRPLLHHAQSAIGIEPPGGKSTGAPTGEIVAFAPVVWQAT